MTEPEQREKKHAALYFDPQNSDSFKALGARIRAEGGRTTLNWSNQWKGPESLLPEARAVVIQTGCKNADAICQCYQQYASDVEIHFVNADGEFDDGDGSTDDETEDGTPGASDEDATPDTVVQGDAESEDGGSEEDASGTDGADSDGGEIDSEQAGPDGSIDPGRDAGDRLEV